MKKILVLAAMFVASVSFAQDMDVVKGDLNILKSESEMNVEFDYSSLKLLKDNLSESEYVANRTKELNEKSRGNGDVWKKKWEGAKEMIWNPKFMELVNVVLKKEDKNLYLKEGAASKYTLIVKVDWIFPGWDVYMMKQPAKVTTTLRVVETANKSNVLVEVTSKDAPGDQWGNNFSNESRIGEGFAKTGKSFAKLMAKKMK